MNTFIQFNRGLLSEVKQYSEQWKVPDLTRTQILKKDLDSTAKKFFMNRMWRTLFKSRKIVVRMDAEKTSTRPYFMFSRLEAKLVLAWRVCLRCPRASCLFRRAL